MADDAAPRGFSNPGGLDYLIAITQAISVVPELTHRLLFWDDPSLAAVTAAHETVPPEGDALRTALAELAGDAPVLRVAGALQRTLSRTLASPPDATVGLADLMWSFGWTAGELVQQDAHEMLAVLLSALDKEMAQQVVCLADGTTCGPIESLFSDQLVQGLARTIHCRGCDTTHVRPTPETAVHVPIRGYDSLSSALQDGLLAQEILDGDNRYACSACGNKCDAALALRYQSLGPVLIFNLGRISFDYETFQRVKLDHSVSFPIELDMADFVSGSDEQPDDASTVYGLAAVIVHSGRADGGRYYAYTRLPGSDQWWRVNGASVDPADLSPGSDHAVDIHSNGYMLIYRRIDDASAAADALTPSDLVSPILFDLANRQSQ